MKAPFFTNQQEATLAHMPLDSTSCRTEIRAVGRAKFHSIDGFLSQFIKEV
jgi:hypothetical protein